MVKPKTKGALVKASKQVNAVTLVSTATKTVTEGLKMFAELFTLTDAPLEVVVQAYHSLHKQMEKPIDDMRKAAREGLLMVLTVGTEQYTVNGSTYEVKLEQPVARTPNGAAVTAALTEAGLDVGEGCDQQVSYIPNDDKLKGLVAAGKLTKEQYLACFKQPSMRLSVEKV